MVSPASTALVAVDAQHVELADQVSENNGTVTRPDSVSQSARDSGAAAMSSAARILLPRPLAFVCYVHRRTSPPLLVPPSVGRSVMATASEVDTPRYKDAELV